MSVPKSGPDGLRQYGHGNRICREHTTQCVESVVADWSSYQCSRPRGHGPDGLYCKQHDPAAERAATSTARYEAGRDREKRSRIAAGLAHATIDQLRAELARRGEK